MTNAHIMTLTITNSQNLSCSAETILSTERPLTPHAEKRNVTTNTKKIPTPL